MSDHLDFSAVGPEGMIADEPTTALDVTIQAQIHEPFEPDKMPLPSDTSSTCSTSAATSSLRRHRLS